MADRKTAGPRTGIDRWEPKRATQGGSRARGRGARPPRRRRRLAADARRQLWALACALVLVLASVAVAWPPSQTLGWGLDFAGGTVTTLALPDGTEADDATVCSALEGRLAALGVRGARVGAEGDGRYDVSVPASDGADDAVSAAARAGHLELVRLDSVSDAEAVAKISAGTTGVSLAPGTYQALVDGSEVSDATVTRSSSSGSDTYVVVLTLTDSAAERFSEATAELAPVYGKVAVVVDGSVVAAPSVSQRIEGGKVSISAGFGQADAEALAAALRTGALPASLDQVGTAQVAPVADAAATGSGLVAAAAVLAACLVGCFVALRLSGLVPLASALFGAALGLGCLAALSRAGAFELTAAGAVASGACVLALLAAAALVSWRARSVLVDARGHRAALRLGRAFWVGFGRAAAVLAVAAAGWLAASLLGALPAELASCWVPLAVLVPVSLLALVLVCYPLLRLVAAGPGRSRPSAWGLAPAPGGADEARL